MRAVPWLFVLAAVCVMGCKAQPPDSSEDTPEDVAATGAMVKLPERGDIQGYSQSWVTSEWLWSDQQEVARALLPDGSTQPDKRPVGVRLTVSDIHVEQGGAIPVTVEFMNHTRDSMNVLKPFADWYIDDSEGVQLFGPRGPCKYIGPTPTYQLGENAFQTLPFGEVAHGQRELLLEHYDNTSEPGIYSLYFVYQAYPHHKKRGAELGFDNVYSGGWRVGPIAILVGDARQETEFEDNVSLWVPEGGYEWSLETLAGGVALEWEVRVGRDFKDVVTYSLRGPNVFEGLTIHAEVFGNDQYYGLNDFGHPGPPHYAGQEVQQGHYPDQLEWDGRNWNGPSDFCDPKGEAFPAGEYQLRLTLIGMVDTGRGRRPFSIQRVTSVVVTP